MVYIRRLPDSMTITPHINCRSRRSHILQSAREGRSASKRTDQSPAALSRRRREPVCECVCWRQCAPGADRPLPPVPFRLACGLVHSPLLSRRRRKATAQISSFVAMTSLESTWSTIDRSHLSPLRPPPTLGDSFMPLSTARIGDSFLEALACHPPFIMDGDTAQACNQRCVPRILLFMGAS